MTSVRNRVGRHTTAVGLGVVGLLLVVSPGCYKGTEGGDDEVPGGQLCNGEDPSATPLRRLSRAQYENTVADLLGPDVADGVMPGLEPLLADLPPDGEGDGFENMDLRISQRHINGYYAVAEDVATRVSADGAADGWLASVAGSCSIDATLDPVCAEEFIRDFGLRAFRRPLSEDEVAGFQGLIDSSQPAPAVFHDLLFAMMMSPNFLYHFETAGAPIDGREDLVALSAWEVASRLSYHFWQSMPDDELFAVAADGSLATEQGYLAQVERITGDSDNPRLRASIHGFYRDWYRLDDFGGFVDTAAFNAFSQGASIDDDIHGAMVEEIEALTDYYTWQTEGTFADMILSDRSFTSSATLAALYGVETWDGEGEPPQFPDGERAGLLTRAALLVTGDESTGPFHRGASIRKRVLCENLAPPDPNTLPEDALDPPPLDATQTTRERFAAKTMDPVCQGCHGLINPVGFALESYDALGRYRTEEQIFDDTGALLATRPIDTVVTPPGLADGNPEIDGPVALMELIAQSGAIEGCFAENYFQYTYRRQTDTADSCVVEDLERSLVEDGGSVRAVLTQIALQPEFRVRLVE